jgi:hypothetical protein
LGRSWHADLRSDGPLRSKNDGLRYGCRERSCEIHLANAGRRAGNRGPGHCASLVLFLVLLHAANSRVIVVGTSSVTVEVETEMDVLMLMDTEVVVNCSVVVVVVGWTVVTVWTGPDTVWTGPETVVG